MSKPQKLRLTCFLAMCSLAIGHATLHADEIDLVDTSDQEDKAAEVELKATEIGVRFTPAMARAMSTKFTQQMKSRYDLDDGQEKNVKDVIQRQLIKFANENSKAGRDIFEMMMATAIEHDGRFPKDSAIEFAKLAKPIIPALEKFFTESAAEIGKQMTVKQRLQFTGDMAGITAGLVLFKNRMKRWEEGDVGEFANPFWDSNDNNAEDEREPTDPNETKEHREARRRAENRIRWETNVERQWERYVNNARVYYGFDDKQTAAAEAILKECRERAKSYKTAEWRKKIRDVWIAETLAWKIDEKFNRGPWKYQLDKTREELMKPLEDIGAELKRRIEIIPTSKQRAEAKESVRKVLSEKGMKRVPV